MLQVRFNVSLVECSIDCGGCGPSPLFWPGYIHLPVILETFLEHFWNIFGTFGTSKETSTSAVRYAVNRNGKLAILSL